MNHIDIMKTPFLLFQSHHDDYYNMSQESLRGIQQESILSKVFFHPKNVDLIQKQIIIEVFRKTNGEYLLWLHKTISILPYLFLFASIVKIYQDFYFYLASSRISIHLLLHIIYFH